MRRQFYFVTLCVLSILACNVNPIKEVPMTENQSVFFVLSTGKIQPASEPSPASFHIKGHFSGGRFIVESQVLGSGILASSGRPGWMEIPSGQFYSQEVMRGQTPPYINGYMTEEGFIPSSRQVH